MIEPDQVQAITLEWALRAEAQLAQRFGWSKVIELPEETHAQRMARYLRDQQLQEQQRLVWESQEQREQREQARKERYQQEQEQERKKRQEREEGTKTVRKAQWLARFDRWQEQNEIGVAWAIPFITSVGRSVGRNPGVQQNCISPQFHRNHGI